MTYSQHFSLSLCFSVDDLASKPLAPLSGRSRNDEVMPCVLYLVNNCVGLLNYRYFFNFILSCSILCMITSASCGLAAYSRWDVYKNDPGLFFAYNIPSFFIGFIALMFLLTLSSFWCYHCRLAMSGATTREDMKSQGRGAKERGAGPRSYCRNLMMTWCGPVQPS